MGGRGSGNFYHWWRPRKKGVVADCLSLDANRWAREGAFRAGVRKGGCQRWTYKSGSAFTVQFEVDILDLCRPLVRLRYSWASPSTRQEGWEDYRVGLTTTRPTFGGQRWWFVCPLVVGGRPCERRVG